MNSLAVRLTNDLTLLSKTQGLHPNRIVPRATSPSGLCRPNSTRLAVSWNI